jgi:hypothetical protein
LELLCGLLLSLWCCSDLAAAAIVDANWLCELLHSLLFLTHLSLLEVHTLFCSSTVGKGVQTWFDSLSGLGLVHIFLLIRE